MALDGKYGLDKEDLDFHGKLRMQAKISQTTTGVKSFVLKAVDPFFRKERTDRGADQDYRPARASILRSRPPITKIKTKKRASKRRRLLVCDGILPRRACGTPPRQPPGRRRYSKPAHSRLRSRSRSGPKPPRLFRLSWVRRSVQGLPPGSGKSVSEDFSNGSWSRCPSWPGMEVLPGSCGLSCSTAPLPRSWSSARAASRSFLGSVMECPRQARSCTQPSSVAYRETFAGGKG